MTLMITLVTLLNNFKTWLLNLGSCKLFGFRRCTYQRGRDTFITDRHALLHENFIFLHRMKLEKKYQ